MPTYGFIQETVEDRWHEREGGTATAEPVTVTCPMCGEELAGDFALASHLGDAHPLAAPRLLVDGEIVSGERVVHRHAQEITVTNTTELLVARDGAAPLPWSPAALRDFVAESPRALLDVTLRNERAVDAATATERVRLRLEIPDEVDLAGVDAAFSTLDPLDEHAANAFVDASREFPSAARYAAALHDYAVGVLIKDRAPGTATALPFERFHGKFHRALDVLRHFLERPVAHAVAGFVRFNLNDFRGPCGVPELDRCAARLVTLAGLEIAPPAHDSHPVAGRCPADAATGAILSAWDRRDADALLGLAAAASPADAAKCRALALDLLEGGDPRRALAARALGGDLVFGPWATSILEDAGS